MKPDKLPHRKNASFLTPYLSVIVEMKDQGFTFREITDFLREKIPDRQVLINNVIRFYHRNIRADSSKKVETPQSSQNVNEEYINKLTNPMEGINNPGKPSDIVASILSKAKTQSDQGKRLKARRELQQRKKEEGN